MIEVIDGGSCRGFQNGLAPYFHSDQRRLIGGNLVPFAMEIRVSILSSSDIQNQDTNILLRRDQSDLAVPLRVPFCQYRWVKTA